MPSPFIEQVRNEMRLRGYSYQTEKTYLRWIRNYIRYNKMAHPAELADECSDLIKPDTSIMEYNPGIEVSL